MGRTNIATKTHPISKLSEIVEYIKERQEPYGLIVNKDYNIYVHREGTKTFNEKISKQKNVLMGIYNEHANADEVFEDYLAAKEKVKEVKEGIIERKQRQHKAPRKRRHYE